ncbi:GGDEF domain-containing protein [Marinomonas sp. 15G1-11]|uniref:diguanylate cyclase n=1 Tax=Marinomonas phaeophyticola TaxID=3004091 RepID=A0ABT4JZK2_9GAMM|nr:GGDEF domain-containing protein [Marinomonas sp. 15G1-11]MCZ2723671.1 GGDEF domain-containing protein [Marinomonas sp. 15G1-11]
MPFNKSHKRFYRISWQIGLGFFLIVICLISISVIAFDRLNMFQKNAEYNEKTIVPNFEILSRLKLHVTSLSSYSRELINANSLAKLRTSYEEVDALIKITRIDLESMQDKEFFGKMSSLISVLEPGLVALYQQKSKNLQLNSQIDRKISSILDYFEEKQLDNQHESLEVAYRWNTLSYQVSRSLFDLVLKTRKFEIQRAQKDLLAGLSLLNELELESDTHTLMLINSEINGPLGLVSMLEIRSDIQFKLVGISTQNSIISENILDYVTALFNGTKENLSGQASKLVMDAKNAQLRLNAIVFTSVLIILCIYLGLRYKLFNRIQLLRKLLASGVLTSQQLIQFKDRNEIGEFAFQLREFLVKIEAQQLTITRVSRQLADVIRHSNLRIAVLTKQNIVYHNEYFADVFSVSSIHSIQNLPEEFHDIPYCEYYLDEDSDPKVLLESYYDEVYHRWFDLLAVPIIWENEKSLLLSLVDVTERQNAAAMYEKNLSEVEDQAYRDSLTGLYNRKKFDQISDDITQDKVAREYSMLVFDIDFFKSYNDMLGHLAGDDALKRVANALSSVTPENGLCLRYGGEEFVVVLFEITLQETLIVAENALKAVNDSKIAHPKAGSAFLSLSIGIAMSFESGNEFLKCFDLADKRLFLAKSNGRNNFVFTD